MPRSMSWKEGSMLLTSSPWARRKPMTPTPPSRAFSISIWRNKRDSPPVNNDSVSPLHNLQLRILLQYREQRSRVIRVEHTRNLQARSLALGVNGLAIVTIEFLRHLSQRGTLENQPTLSPRRHSREIRLALDLLP